MASPIWVVDSSSIILARSLYSRKDHTLVLDGLGRLVVSGRLVFPREVVAELERYAGAENPALAWASGISHWLHSGSHHSNAWRPYWPKCPKSSTPTRKA